jgi:undecaprenyl-diphosphatase
VTSISIGQSVILGIVEGLTEFLPISSTGHLKNAEGFMDLPVDDDAVVGFTAVIQTGAIAAVLVYFRRDIWRIVAAWFRGLRDDAGRDNHDFRFAWWVIYATIPVVLVGVAAKKAIDGPLGSLWVVAGSLLVGSAFMWWADRNGTFGRGEHQTTLRDAMLIGSAQVLALLFPGFSRSGATMSTGILLNLDRVAAARVSFFLGLPALTGAGIYELKDATGGDVSTGALAVGTLISFVVAYASIAWLLRFVTRHTFDSFVVYRVVLAIALIGLLVGGALDA